MGDRKINPLVYKAIVYLAVAVACYGLLLVKIYFWEEKLIFNIFTRERIADIAVVVIVAIVAYLLYGRLRKSID